MARSVGARARKFTKMQRCDWSNSTNQVATLRVLRARNMHWQEHRGDRAVHSGLVIARGSTQLSTAITLVPFELETHLKKRLAALD